MDIEDWRWPEDYDVTDVCERVTTGPGWVLLKKMFSDRDVEMARERILINKIQKTKGGRFSYTDDSHNNFSGLTWGLLSRGKIFAKVSLIILTNIDTKHVYFPLKMATHPVILEVSRRLLGDKCRLSSLSANSVLPGMEGQAPHLDYPYYRHLW